MILSSTSKSIQVKLGSTPTTNNIPVFASYSDVSTADFSMTAEDSQSTDLSNNTATDVVSPPGASTDRKVTFLTVQNADTVSAAVTVQFHNTSGPVTTVIWKGTLASGDNLVYTDAEGFNVMDASGNRRSAVLSGGLTGVSLGGNTAGTMTLISSGTLQFNGGSNITLSQNGQSVTVHGERGFKKVCAAVANSSITLSGEQTIDGVPLNAGDRILVNGQFDETNGIYIVATGAWSRADDFADGSVQSQVFVFVLGGNHGNCLYEIINDDLVVGTDFFVAQKINALGAPGWFNQFDSDFLLSAVPLNVDLTATTGGKVSVVGLKGSTLPSNVTDGFLKMNTAGNGWEEVQLAAGNNITLSRTGSTLSISAFNQSVQTQGFVPGYIIGGNTSGTPAFTSAALTLIGGNNITLSQSQGLITISAFNQTAGSNTFGMSNLGNTSGTSGVVSGDQLRVLWAGGNNVTLSQSVNGASATITVSAFNQSAESQSGGISNLGNTSGTSGIASGAQMRLLFAGGNNVTLSQSVNGASATITISTPNMFAGGVSNLGSTAGSTGTVSSQMVLVGSNGILLSQSTGGASNATITIQPTPYKSNYWPVYPMASGTSQLGNATMFIWPVKIHDVVTASRVNHVLSMSVSSSSNSSHAGTISASFGIYTLNVSTLSLASSGSQTYGWTNTSNNSTSVLSGLRQISMPVNMNITPGEYYLAFHTRTTTAGNNWFTASNVLMTGLSQQFSGFLGSATNSSNQYMPGFGMYSNNSFSTAMPSSIHVSDVKGGHAGALAQVPLVEFCNVTF